ncbi:MAG: carbohydrate-binding domain-containing protein [Ruminococcus sp.]|nr:carbohydrate-binding domain-containing protein [Ruminococcus sp.]
MNYKRFLAALTAAFMAAASVSCGEDKPGNSDTDTPAVTDESDSAETEKATEKEETTEKEVSEKTTEKKSEKTTAAAEKTDKETKTTAAKTTKKTDKKEDKTETTEAESSENSEETTEEKTEATTTKAAEKTTEAATKAPTEVPTTPNGKTYDAVITFNETVSVEGVNAEISGSVVKITAGGDYIVKGSTSNGQIYISTATEEKVEITLDNVDISCGGGPAIFVNEAKRCVLKLAEGSTNYLSDGGNDKINDGVIFTNDTLRIKGDGYLEINAGNAHGIASDDDVIIESGEYLINSIKSGIIANDNITVNGGELKIFGGTNGMKSKGTMVINDGTIWACGGVKEEKSSVYAASGLYYRGGYVYAAGNQVTPPTESPNPYIVVNWLNGQPADTTVGFNLGGTEFAALTPKAPFRCVMMLAPDILVGDGFTPVVNGNGNGDFTVADGQNLFVIE